MATRPRAGGGARQAALFSARRRRASKLFPGLFVTHRIVGASSIPVASIDTGARFPSRAGLITFAVSIAITANGGTHAGLVFEFGGAAHGCALWVGDETIGFHAGAAGTVDGATALFDNGAELAPGLALDLVAAVRVGDGSVRLWGNGVELARSQASGLVFDPLEWSSGDAGSFASGPAGAVVTDVPAASDGAPAGFTVVSPLYVFAGQAPRHFG